MTEDEMLGKAKYMIYRAIKFKFTTAVVRYNEANPEVTLQQLIKKISKIKDHKEIYFYKPGSPTTDIDDLIKALPEEISSEIRMCFLNLSRQDAVATLEDVCRTIKSLIMYDLLS